MPPISIWKTTAPLPPERKGRHRLPHDDPRFAVRRFATAGRLAATRYWTAPASFFAKRRKGCSGRCSTDALPTRPLSAWSQDGTHYWGSRKATPSSMQYPQGIVYSPIRLMLFEAQVSHLPGLLRNRAAPGTAQRFFVCRDLHSMRTFILPCCAISFVPSPSSFRLELTFIESAAALRCALSDRHRAGLCHRLIQLRFIASRCQRGAVYFVTFGYSVAIPLSASGRVATSQAVMWDGGLVESPPQPLPIEFRYPFGHRVGVHSR